MMDIGTDGTVLKRGPYEHFDDEERAQIGRYAADHGVAAAVRHYTKMYPCNAQGERKQCVHVEG